jgi:DNA ligase-1
MRREFLQLADHYNPDTHDVSGRFISEKLDGTRCFWDGGLSRGLPTTSIPWASVTDPKTGHRKGKIKPHATGLWSRYGNPIMAPDWFLNQLPCCPLDGELWAGPGNFQLCRSICAGDEPDPRFDQIVYAAYSSPPMAGVFADGEIKNTNMVCNIDHCAIERWVRRRLPDFDEFVSLPLGVTFADELKFMAGNLENTEASVCYMHTQHQLANTRDDAARQVEDFLSGVLDRGGEGVVIRSAQATWIPKRHKGLLKFKPFSDAEATVTGFTSGRETNKGSRLLGMIGALIVDYNGKRLELSGLSDTEREFLNPDMTRTAAENPGKDMPGLAQGKHFKVGQTVSFKYRELSDDGIPKEARLWRKRDVE